MFPDTRNNITYVTFQEVLSTLEVKEKEAKIKNETFENQEQHSVVVQQQLITPFEWLFAKSVRYPMVPTTTMVHRYIAEMKSHC
jgi:hypothetical protein